MMKRRSFLKRILFLLPAGGILGTFIKSAAAKTISSDHELTAHYYGMGIRTEKCIGCGRCMEACKNENDVPKEPFFVRTWVERYIINKNNDVIVENLNGGGSENSKIFSEQNILRSFFVPKLCNQCDNPPCVQVCPVGATFQTEDGVILVDENRCIGCSYCIQACPYGARYLHPERKTADKCTFCYHRIKQGLLPACVEVCPTQTRVFGDLKSWASPLTRLRRMHNIRVLKPYLNTEPKVFYTDLDGEVR